PVVLGHALLRTPWESAREHQPFTADNQTWIVADCRIDGREDLVGALGDASLRGAPDPELILAALSRWGERSVERLLGDFSFAIWDEGRRTLFCARDQLGVKPFFYAQCGESFVFSNDLGCMGRHPSIPDDLDSLAI